MENITGELLTSEPTLSKRELIAVEILKISGQNGVSLNTITNAVQWADRLIRDSDLAEINYQKDLAENDD